MKPSGAKLFQNGGRPAARPTQAQREDRRVIVEPADEWSPEFRSCLGSVSGDIPRLKQAGLHELRNALV